MRPPVGNDLRDFLDNWYIASPFGENRGSYIHSGDDLNLKTGGDTDLGQPLYAVADGRIVYYHNYSHPSSRFGRHMFLECETIRGRRWYHYAHCQEITNEIKFVKEGDLIGRVGKSGTTYAHLHLAVLKIDPATMYDGIDSIARNVEELNLYWEKFELLESSQEDNMASLLEYLGVPSEADAKLRLKEHLGEQDEKCNWGQEGDNGGYLGSARKRIRELENQDPITPPIEPSIKWVVNGKTETFVENGKTININYAVVR